MEKRYVDMLKAAAPYAPASAQAPIAALLQLQSISDQIADMRHGQFEKIVREQADLEAAELEACDMDQGNMEAMLTQMENFCSPREREMIHMILNFTRAGKMLRSYQQFSRQMGVSGKSPSPMDFLMTQLNEEQRAAFEMMRMMMETPTTPPQ